MKATQQIFRVRRNYNQWVNNQTLEDYALRFTAKASRRWSLARVANTALGAISFLALEAIGGAITISYGFDNALVSILIVSTIIFFAGIPICYYAAKYGVDIDLLTRGAGFGYIGSTTTSLIYASFTFIFFALEAAIMAMALKLMVDLPLQWGYVVSAVVIIPLVTHGITFISRFQLWTQPIWVTLQLLPIGYIFYHDFQSVENWQAFTGLDNQYPEKVSLIYFGAASAVIFSLIAQIGEQVDYLRFLPEKTQENKFRWWFALLAAGPGWIIIGALKLLAGSFLAYFLLAQGFSAEDAADPARMYIVAFERMIQSPNTALAIGGLFVILSQVKINVTNAYTGSIAWSNFFSRLTHSHPGRVVWLIFNVVIALMLMELGIYQAFEQTLGIFAIIAIGWVGTIVADLIINKPLGLSPPTIEFKRAHLYDINPVGLGSMVLACIVGLIFYSGELGEVAKALAHFFTLLGTFIFAPLIAYLTKSKYYIARQPDPLHLFEALNECCICENHYEKEDMAFCPAYAGNICSLCCSLDARCHDSCKSVKKLPELVKHIVAKVFPKKFAESINSRFIQFILLVSIIASISSVLLSLIYFNATTDSAFTNQMISNILWQVFLLFLIIAGITSWLFVLAHESRIVAQEESQRQNLLLTREIDAHEKTDKELQRAKENAEAANNAKSRYLTGISHELRSPLNSILGYAQLLEKDKEIPQTKKSQINVIRSSSEHLADLIEGLLDISQIEAGRLHIHRDQVRINNLMDQLVYMFKLQAENKGLEFTYHCITPLPEFVTTDEKRLRQILINLLSNAIKFTDKGFVSLSLFYRNQVAEFKITDSGAGIPESEVERIFRPFERIHRENVETITGTGLGLTIVKLLTEIMGGDIHVNNNPKGGCTFTVSLMLSDIVNPDKESVPMKTVYGYEGNPKTIMVVDDDASHRRLVNDILSPLGFIVIEATSGNDCLLQSALCKVDTYLMDISMPGLNGWETSEKLRLEGYTSPIIMLSANAHEMGNSFASKQLSNDYIVKPLKIDTLFDKLTDALNLQWHYETPDANVSKETIDYEKYPDNIKRFLNPEDIEAISDAAEVGDITSIKLRLNAIPYKTAEEKQLIDQLYSWAEEIKLQKILSTLKESTL